MRGRPEYARLIVDDDRTASKLGLFVVANGFEYHAYDGESALAVAHERG